MRWIEDNDKYGKTFRVYYNIDPIVDCDPIMIDCTKCCCAVLIDSVIIGCIVHQGQEDHGPSNLET